MTHVNESLLKHTAIYRCCDDITNLKIRIKLTECGHVIGEEWDQKDFGWQQKAFSKTEREVYKDVKNCITDLEKKYHEDVVLTEDDTKLNIFSYVNEDNHLFKQPNVHCIEENVEESDQYDYKGSLLKSLKNPRSYNCEFNAMFIMADLGEYVDNTWIKHETELCSVKYDKNCKVLSVYPDFTNFGSYRIRISGDTPRNFKYTVENVSEAIPEERGLKERKLMAKINNHKLDIARQLHSTFTLPSKNKLQINLHFEILWAKYCEYDTIYIQYFIDLPPNMSCYEKFLLQGMTHTCRTKDQKGSAHFGHVFDVNLISNVEELQNSAAPKCPCIYFEVISKDGWSRYRTEGLAYMNVPISKPGIYQKKLQCFRLVSQSILKQLRRYFIGDCSNHGDVTWTGVPKDHTSPILNKYGTTTVRAGQIGIRLNVVHQSQAFLDCVDYEQSQIFEKLHSSSLVKSVEQVLLAFKRARKNMLLVRKNV